MARILGLDLGSFSIKALLLDSTQRGQASLQGYFEVLRPVEGDRMQTLRVSLEHLIKNHALHAEQVVVSLPGPALATHHLTLPFNETKKIEAALPFEVEGQLPFDLSDATFDYQITAQTTGKSDLLVGVMRRAELSALLTMLTELNLDPRIVTHPAIAYQNLAFPYANPDEKGPIAIVDIGHERTSIAIRSPNGPLETARTFAGGGKDLTRAIAQELKTGPLQANHWKENQGALASAAAHSPDLMRGAIILTRALQPILRELRATMKSYAGRTHRQVTRVELCGGTARLPGIAEQLTQDLGMETVLWKPPAELKNLVPDGAAPAAAQPYALALRALQTGAKAPRFNMRRGDQSFTGAYDYLRERGVRLAAYSGVVLALFVAFGLARNSVLSSHESAVDAQLCKITQSVLGRCEKNYDKALNLLQGKGSPAAAVPKVSAVNILAELTARIPSDVPVTFDQLLVDTERVSLRGTTDSSKQIDRITQALKGFKCFKEIQVGKLEKTKTDKFNFHLDIQVDCADLPTSG